VPRSQLLLAALAQRGDKLGAAVAALLRLLDLYGGLSARPCRRRGAGQRLAASAHRATARGNVLPPMPGLLAADHLFEIAGAQGGLDVHKQSISAPGQARAACQLFWFGMLIPYWNMFLGSYWFLASIRLSRLTP
jgi:hypothetical protein